MTITDALISEHRAFAVVFAQADRLLNELHSTPEVQVLARLCVAMLHDHGDAEENLAFAALDHLLAERGQLDRLYQEHQEVDLHFRQVLEASHVGRAKELLSGALRATREHFAWEEGAVFPLLDEILQMGTLQRLGAARAQRGAALPV
jgi:hypothetical protein